MAFVIGISSSLPSLKLWSREPQEHLTEFLRYSVKHGTYSVEKSFKNKTKKKNDNLQHEWVTLTLNFLTNKVCEEWYVVLIIQQITDKISFSSC